MNDIQIKADSPIDQLVEATESLIEESIGIFTGLSLTDLSASDLNKLANNILKSIDKTGFIVERLDGIPNPDLIRLRMRLQRGIDQLYSTLMNVKTDWANRHLTLQLSGREVIDYGSFCYSLALKLTERVSEAVLKENSLPNTDHLYQYYLSKEPNEPVSEQELLNGVREHTEAGVNIFYVERHL